MKDLNTNRIEAIRDMRKTLTSMRAASTRIGILRHCEVLAAQVFYLRQMVTKTITKGQVLYPENDWEFYRNAVDEEMGELAAS
jgi:hypothetical protein